MEEIRLLEEEKETALSAGDYDSVEQCQTLIDSLQERLGKIGRGGGRDTQEHREDPMKKEVTLMVHIIGCEGLSALDKRKKKLCDSYVRNPPRDGCFILSFQLLSASCSCVVSCTVAAYSPSLACRSRCRQGSRS